MDDKKERMTEATQSPSTSSGAKVERFSEISKDFESFLVGYLKNNNKLKDVFSDVEIQETAEGIVDEFTARMTAKEAESLNDANDDMIGVSAADLLTQPVTDLPTLYDPIIPLGVVGVLGGESEANKSMFLRQLAICTATGRDFLGYKYKGTNKLVFYVSTEDNEYFTTVLLKKNFQHYPDDKEGDWGNLRFVFDVENLSDRLEDCLKKHPADLIIIDSLSDVFDDKDTNNMAQMRKFLKPYTRLANDYQCVILFLHHVGKGKENLAPSKNLLNGSGALEAAARFVFLLFKDKSTDNLRHFCIVKNNYLAPEYKKESVVLSIDPNTLTFEPTGMHVPFEELAEKSCANMRKPISEYGSDDDFKQFFQQVCAGGISKTALVHKIKEHFHMSQDKAYNTISHAGQNKWITKNQKEKYEYSAEF